MRGPAVRDVLVLHPRDLLLGTLEVDGAHAVHVVLGGRLDEQDGLHPSGIAGVKRYDRPANLFFSAEARAAWGRLWTEWTEAFPRGRIALTSGSYHYPHHDDVDLVVREYRALLERAGAPTSAPGRE